MSQRLMDELAESVKQDFTEVPIYLKTIADAADLLDCFEVFIDHVNKFYQFAQINNPALEIQTKIQETKNKLLLLMPKNYDRRIIFPFIKLKFKKLEI